jgi:hypothetical protein
MRSTRGKPDGVFRKYIWNPVSEGATKYRLAKRETLTKYLELVKPVEQTMKSEPIPAPELGYTFRGRAELLGALLHTRQRVEPAEAAARPGLGSSTNRRARSLTLGRLRARAPARRRAHEDRTTTTCRACGISSSELKPDAQKAHKEMYGHYFSEITAEPFTTPFGDYAGGYYPALTDNFIVTDAGAQREQAGVPAGRQRLHVPDDRPRLHEVARRGVREAAAARRGVVPLGIDAVLRFTHIEPRVKDVGRMMVSRDFRPGRLSTRPSAGNAGALAAARRAAADPDARQLPGDKFWRESPERTGLQIMTANVVDALEQITTRRRALVKVEARGTCRRALALHADSRRSRRPAILEKSDYMRTRETAAVMEMQKTIDNLLLDPSKYEKRPQLLARARQLPVARVQQRVDVVTWSAPTSRRSSAARREARRCREADSIVRETQGSFEPEVDVTLRSVDAVPADALSSTASSTRRRTCWARSSRRRRAISGLRKGAGRLLYVYALGFMVPAIKNLAAGPLDEDDDGPVDDVFRLFFESQADMATRMIPMGSVVSSAIGAFTKSTVRRRHHDLAGSEDDRTISARPS